MKTHFFHRFTLVGLFIAAAAADLHAQAVQPAPADWEALALGRLGGQTLRAVNDEPISTVADYLIDPRSGELRFVVVPSGAGPGGQTYRLVPMAALDLAASNPQSLKLRVDRGTWDRVGTLTQDWLRDEISIDTEHRRRLAQQFNLGSALPADGATVILRRASSLKGRPLLSGNQTLGTINDVVIDLPSRAAWALVGLGSNLGGDGRNYLFPFDQMQIPEGRGPATTSLTRNDFAATGPTPTGFPSGGQNLNGMISSVQQAVLNVSSVPRGSVQVMPESRIVLRGTVENEQQKAEVHRAATQAAPGVRIDNEVIVRSRW